MIKKKIYYKVLSPDNKAQNGGDFDYTPYLPKQKKDGTWKAGKWLPKRTTKLCESGWHITQYWNMWVKTEHDKIYFVETKKVLSEDKSVGVEEKICAEQIRLIKPFTPDFDNQLNIGDLNTGNSNTGDRNTGNRNTGNWNTGNRNTGDRNTGYWNTGYRNTGNRNTGNRNTGNWNTGNRNTGYWNTGNYHTGWFNTPKHEAPKLLFGKPYTGEALNFPKWLYVELPTKEKWLKAFKKASKKELQQTLILPNFDYEVFEEITGISKKMFTKKLSTKKGTDEVKNG